MKYNPEIHHRRSTRLKGCDYSKAYFITLCTYNRQCIYGDIEDVEMRLDDMEQVPNTVGLYCDAYSACGIGQICFDAEPDP